MVKPTTAKPPSMSPLHAEGRLAISPPMPPKWAPFRRKATRDLPATKTSPWTTTRVPSTCRNRRCCPVPNYQCEVLSKLHRPRQFQDSVTIVEGLRRGVDRAITDTHPDVSFCVNRWCRATHPDSTLTFTRFCVDGENRRFCARLLHRYNATPVGGAIAVIASHSKDHATLI